MMGNIDLKTSTSTANHGCMVEEGKIGSDYVVNVKVKTDLSKSIVSDRSFRYCRLCFTVFYCKRRNEPKSQTSGGCCSKNYRSHFGRT